MENTKENASSREYRTNAYVNSQRLVEHTSPIEIQATSNPSTETGGYKQNPNLNHKSLCTHFLCSSFHQFDLMDHLWDYYQHSKEDLCPGVVGQHSKNSVLFVDYFHFSIFRFIGL